MSHRTVPEKAPCLGTYDRSVVRKLAPEESASTTAHLSAPSCAVYKHVCICVHAYPSGAICMYVLASECVNVCV